MAPSVASSLGCQCIYFNKTFFFAFLHFLFQVKTSSQIAKQETSSLVLPTSVKSLTRKGSLTNSQTQVIKTTVHPILSESTSLPLESSTLLITGSKTSAQGTRIKETRTQWSISSSTMSRSFLLSKIKTSAGSVKHSIEVIMHTNTVSSLTSTNMELATVVTSPPSYREQTILSARSSLNVSGTSFEKIEDSKDIPPIGQLKSSKDFTTSVISTDVKGTSIAGKSSKAIKTSPSVGYSRKESVMQQQKDSIKSFVTIGTIVSSPSTGSYQKGTLLPGETDVKRNSTAAEYKTKAFRTSASSGSDQRSTLVIKQSTPVVQTPSLTRRKTISSQSTLEIPVSESTYIKPSKTSEEISSGAQTTPGRQPTTQYPQVTSTDSPSKGKKFKYKDSTTSIVGIL